MGGIHGYVLCMKTPTPHLFACVLVAVACLAWVGGISWAIAYFLGLSAIVGWCIAGSLGFSAIVAVTIILYEMRHSLELSELEEPVDVERSSAGNHRGAPLGNSSLAEGAAASFRSPDKFY